MQKMTLGKLARLGGVPIKSNKQVAGICVDTRMLKPGELFFALPGNKVDGHQYIEEAARKGAMAAIVDKGYSGLDYGLLLIRVASPLALLQDLAKHLLAKQNPRIVAVTGSVGKTTTKEFITALLRKKFKVASTPKNANSQIGMPLSIINHFDGDEDIIVVEMGMSQPKQISKLVEIAPPDVAVITSVALVHAENFDKLEDIALAKAEILTHPKTQLGIINHDIKNFSKIMQIGNCKKISFSTTSAKADYLLKSMKEGMKITTAEEEVLLKKLPIPGKHNLNNFLAAAAVARYFDLSWKEIEDAMQELQLPDNRLQFVEKKGITFINDAYNACTLSVKAALQSIPKPKSDGRRIFVFGHMVELGKFSEECHQEVGQFALDYVEKLFCLGDKSKPAYEIWKNEKRSVELTSDFPQLMDMLRKDLKEGDVVLIKGSNSHKLWRVVEEI